MLTAFTYRYDVILGETLKVLVAISTPILIRCLDVIPLLKRQEIDCQIEQCSTVEAFSIMQKRHTLFIVLLPLFSRRASACCIVPVPISIHRQFMFSVGSVSLTMLRQYIFAIIGVMFVRTFSKLFSIPFTVCCHIIDKSLITGVTIASCGVRLLLGATRTDYELHYSIIYREC